MRNGWFLISRHCRNIMEFRNLQTKIYSLNLFIPTNIPVNLWELLGGDLLPYQLF